MTDDFLKKEDWCDLKRIQSESSMDIFFFFLHRTDVGTRERLATHRSLTSIQRTGISNMGTLN